MKKLKTYCLKRRVLEIFEVKAETWKEALEKVKKGDMSDPVKLVVLKEVLIKNK
jgi:hypothetical protein